MEIFKLFGSIFVDNDKANKSIDETDKKGQSTAATLGNMVGTAAKWGAAIVAGAGVAVGGMLALTNQTAAYADEIDKLSERTGINREELQRWRYAAGQSGADIGKLEVGVKKLSDVMAGAITGNKTATESFRRLGISVDDLKNKSQEQIFEQVMTELADMEQGAARNALGNDLLGKSYTELLPLLNAGSEGMDALKNRADELGIVMSEDAVRANVKYGDTMDDLKQAFGGVTREITNAALPIMQNLIDLLLENMPLIQSIAGGVFSFLGAVVSNIGSALQVVIPYVSEFFEFFIDGILGLGDPEAIFGSWQYWAYQLGEAFRMLYELITETVVPAVVEALGWVKENFDVIGPALAAMFLTVIVPAFIAWATAAGAAAAATIAALLPVMAPIAAVGAAVALLALIWRKWGDDITQFVMNAAEKVIGFFGNLKTKTLDIWGGIKSGIKDAVNSIIGFINGMINRVGDGINAVINAINLLPGVEIGTVTMPQIPLLAEGGLVTRGGRAIVGEAGMEVVDLPAGARVTPLDKTGGEVHIHIHDSYIMDDYGTDRLMDRIFARMRDIGSVTA